jgi:hypothetical protein
MRTVTMFGKTWHLREERYANNDRPALCLTDSDTGEPGPTVTINVPSAFVPPGHVIIREYSETVGVLDVLLAAEVIGPPSTYVKTGFVTVPVCPLIDPDASILE